jgi:hypothetical protein
MSLSWNHQSSSSSEPSLVASFNPKFGRQSLAVLASLYTFSFVGALYGWGPMQRLLEGSGAFADACSSSTPSANANTHNDNTVCPEQAQILVNMGFFATTLSIITPLIGSAIDLLGAPVVSYGMSCAAMLGSGLLVVAAITQISFLYWICFALLGLTTFTGSLLSVQVGLYFQGRTQIRMIMWLNTLFDAGSVSYLFLWMIQEFLGARFVTVAIIYFVLSILLFVPSAYFWTVAVPEDDDDDEERSASSFLGETEPCLRADALPDDQEETMTESVSASLRFYMESKMEYSFLKDIVDSRRGSLSMSIRAADGHPAADYPASVVYGSIREVKENDAEKNEDDYVVLADRPANEQLLSVPFIMLNLFFAVSMISCTWSLITAADFLASLGDDDGTYLKIFTLCQPASILALPLVDAIVQQYGFGAAFQTVNVINFIYIVIKCTSTNLHLQVVTFLMVAAVRCFLYAATFSSLPSLLSADVVGRGTGFLAMVGGLASFLNIPLNKLTVGGDFFIPNLMYLLAVIPTTIAARHVQRVIHREKELKEQKDNNLSFVSKLQN